MTAVVAFRAAVWRLFVAIAPIAALRRRRVQIALTEAEPQPHRAVIRRRRNWLARPEERLPPDTDEHGWRRLRP